MAAKTFEEILKYNSSHEQPTEKSDNSGKSILFIGLKINGANSLSIDDGEDPEDFHVTLAYGHFAPRGDEDDTAVRVQSAIKDIRDLIPDTIHFDAIDRFKASESSDGKDVIYARAAAGQLEEAHEAFLKALKKQGIKLEDTFPEYKPHMTLAYIDPGEEYKLSKINASGTATKVMIGYGGESTHENDYTIMKFNPYHDERGRFTTADYSGGSAQSGRTYISFQSAYDCNTFFGGSGGLLQRKKSAEGRWISSLSRDERDAISSYAADGYSDINSYHRKYGDWKSINETRVTEQTKHLDEAISRFELTDNITTYRSIKSDAFGGKGADLKQLVGKIYHDDGFMSTSPVKGSSAHNKDLMMEINVPAGTGRGAYINKMAGQYQNSEYEFLLARGQKFRITGVTEKSGVPTIHMEMIVDG